MKFLKYTLLRGVFWTLLLGLVGGLCSAPQVQAAEVLGIHILNTSELEKAGTLLKTEENKDNWDYVTIPFTLNDLNKREEWQRFFYDARQKKMQPIVRLITRAEGAVWIVPTRKDLVSMFTMLSSLDWPQPEERLVVVFNEPNHQNEWGGRIDPEGYANILQFTADWLHSEDKNFKVLPAGLDLSAPNGSTTMEAFRYIDAMLANHERLLDSIDGWTSHSYPNPAFSAAPSAKGKNSLYGFEYELDYLKKKSSREFPIYITETGWVDNSKTSKLLTQYYEYAVKNVWTDPRIRAVTPFVLQGAPGMFAPFSFLDEKGEPTRHYKAYQDAIQNQN